MKVPSRNPDTILKCLFYRDDGQLCDFAVIDDETNEAVTCLRASDYNIVQLRVHQEKAHGIYALRASEIVRRCDSHDEWLVGYDQIEQHYQRHYEDLVGSGAVPIDHTKHCLFCLHDEQLRFSLRMKEYQYSSDLAKHCNSTHLLRHRSPTKTCPECWDEVGIRQIFDHLIDHGWHLAGKAGLRTVRPTHINGDFSQLVLQGKREERASILQGFEDYIASLDGSMEYQDKQIRKRRSSEKRKVSVSDARDKIAQTRIKKHQYYLNGEGSNRPTRRPKSRGYLLTNSIQDENTDDRENDVLEGQQSMKEGSLGMDASSSRNTLDRPALSDSTNLFERHPDLA
ncbi:uncharacterized protein FA14DRAFT_154463 [Meira miltonrushii]|uniref:Uncharacterized protein n=1 Tax=Meira miltonrushii TaxID=1280837 RepID=A0A316VCK6_9BASI|nr:uncharacterized protein FA14DRAFT_154463 [Meira miltonrushii]PWN35034.1 hypothetical protein FA14DRAFT_154463 [Meira miltonrushii]